MISFALALAASPVAAQMEPARRGMLQCQMPDELFKTCLTLSKVTQAGPGIYRFQTRMLVDTNGPVVATINTTTTVEGDEVCDGMDASDLSSATVTFAGRPIPAAGASRYLAKIKRAFAVFEGKQICTEIVSVEEGLKVRGRIAGKRVPALDYDMMWVDPADGWTVDR